MKRLIALGLIVVLSGCATHANIEMPAVTQVYDKAYENKSIGHRILYSQPEPGVFSGGEQMPMVLLEEATLSVASAATLKNLPDFVFDQLPSTVTRADSGQGDYELLVELTARNKKGPAYYDYEFAKSLAKGLVTLGFGSAEYDLIADFDVKYTLLGAGQPIFGKSYTVSESVDHERGDFESFSSLNEYTGQLLEKHLILTLNDFFTSAPESL